MAQNIIINDARDTSSRDVKGSCPPLHPTKRGLLFTFLRNFIIGYLSHPLDRVSIEKEAILTEMDLIYGLNIEGREKERDIYFAIALSLSNICASKDSKIVQKSSSRALTDDFYVTCFRGILAESFLLKKNL